MAIADKVADLRRRPAAFRCTEIRALLEGLGFKVRDCSSAGHKVFSHPELYKHGFHGSDFNCGHNKKLFVKPAYVRKIANILEEFEAQLDRIAERNI